MFPIADGTVKLSGGDQVLRTSTLIWDNPDRGEEQGNLLGESDGSSIPLYVPREASFPIPMKYNDVTKATSTSLDVMLERRVDDHWKRTPRPVSFVDGIHTIHRIGRKTSRWVYMFR